MLHIKARGTNWPKSVIGFPGEQFLTHSLTLRVGGDFLWREAMPLRDGFTRYCCVTAAAEAQELNRVQRFAKKNSAFRRHSGTSGK
jgi:hypothetical protein